MPLYFYSLKDVARYLGFGGSRGCGWADRWYGTMTISKKGPTLRSGLRAYLTNPKYNEDDVRATLSKNIEKQKPKTRREN